MGEVHAIINLDRYSAYIRRMVAASFSEEYEDNLDEFITIKQTSKIIEEYSLGKDKKGKLLVDEEASKSIFEAVKIRLYNSGLSKLAAKDLLECAWDDKKGEMIFWPKKK